MPPSASPNPVFNSPACLFKYNSFIFSPVGRVGAYTSDTPLTFEILSVNSSKICREVPSSSFLSD